MKNLGYYNGEIDEIENMRIPMDDRACWFGDGVYDATAAIDHKVLFLEEHIDRFFASASLLRITPPLQKGELADLLSALVLKVDSPRQFVYFQLTRGTGPRNHAFPKAGANLWVFLRPSSAPDFSKKIKLVTAEDIRFLHCNIKTLNLIPNVLASQKAKEAGADEAVFYRKTGEGAADSRVTECSHSNIAIIAGGAFRTAPLDRFILPGIARSHLIRQCRVLDIPVIEESFSLKELFSADEIIVSSSGTFCLDADQIDGHSAGGKAPEIVAALRKAVLDEAESYIRGK